MATLWRDAVRALADAVIFLHVHVQTTIAALSAHARRLASTAFELGCPSRAASVPSAGTDAPLPAAAAVSFIALPAAAFPATKGGGRGGAAAAEAAALKDAALNALILANPPIDATSFGADAVSQNVFVPNGVPNELQVTRAFPATTGGGRGGAAAAAEAAAAALKDAALKALILANPPIDATSFGADAVSQNVFVPNGVPNELQVTRASLDAVRSPSRVSVVVLFGTATAIKPISAGVYNLTLCFTNSAPIPKIYTVTPTSVTLSSPSGSSVPGLGAFFKNASVRVSNVGGVGQVIATFTLTKALTSPLAATLTYLTQDLGAIYPTPPLTLRKPQLVYTAPP